MSPHTCQREVEREEKQQADIAEANIAMDQHFYEVELMDLDELDMAHVKLNGS